MLVQVNPSFVLLCFHNTTHSPIRENDNGGLILNTYMQVAWYRFSAPFRMTTA